MVALAELLRAREEGALAIFPPVRSAIALALALVACSACSGSDRSNVPASRPTAASPARGPDALLLRVPKTGGVARVTAYPNVDSTVWTSTDAAPALDHVLAFDADAGLIAAADSRGMPVWIDLHLGTVTIPGRGKLRSLASVDGSTIYGVGTDGAIARYTTSGNWLFKPPQPARAAFPQSNGTLLILGGRGDATRLWRVRPPETHLDSVTIPNATGGTGAPLGDRVFFVEPPRTVVAVKARTLAIGDRIEVDHRIRAIETSPSGDRAYVALDSTNELVIIDAYQNRVLSHAPLPGKARDLRVDPFGRFILARAAASDSVWVLSVGTDRVVETVRSQWRNDLPFVAMDGTIALADGRDVVLHGARGDTRVRDGASDFWYPFVWNGLRARAASLDERTATPAETATVKPPPTPATPETMPTRPPAGDSAKPGFTVSFAVLLDEGRAREDASRITVNGQTARVVTGVTAGTTVYRVVLGPYPTRDDAERAGKAANRTYVVYAGTP